MKRTVLLLAAAFAALSLSAQNFDDHFEDATLRLDYAICGDAHHQAIYLEQLSRTSVWAGRRTNLAEPLLSGNGQVTVRSLETGEILYRNSFSTLFQEWQTWEEAARVQRAYENCFQVPFPKEPVRIDLTLLDVHGQPTGSISHVVDPADILIRTVQDNGYARETLHQGGDPAHAVDIVILAEGYADDEKGKFLDDATRAMTAFLSHEPFTTMQGKITFRAVFSPSQESGVSIPHDGVWKNTALQCHYDTFYSARYLTTSSMRRVYDAIGTVPFEHIIILVNTPNYGGGGVYNNVTISAADHPTFKEVLVHEFGHSFGGLADEYAYDETAEIAYPSDTEPWEPNITTLKDFGRKWADLLPKGTPVPTPRDEVDSRQDVRRVWGTLTAEEKALLNRKIGLYEGGGNQSKGVYRPVQECRMRINECEDFCPVCTRAIVRMIEYYTED